MPKTDATSTSTKTDTERITQLEEQVTELAKLMSAEELEKFAKQTISAAVKAAETKANLAAIKAADRAARRAVQHVFQNADLLVWEGMKKGTTNLVKVPYDAVVGAFNWLIGPAPKKSRA